MCLGGITDSRHQLSRSIGQYASHGCIRMYNADVEQLYDLVPFGTPVIITGDPLKHQRTLEFGDIGADVQWVQQRLRHAGYFRGDVTAGLSKARSLRSCSTSCRADCRWMERWGRTITKHSNWLTERNAIICKSLIVNSTRPLYTLHNLHGIYTKTLVYSDRENPKYPKDTEGNYSMNLWFHKPMAVLANLAGLGSVIAAGVPVWASAKPFSSSHKTVVVAPNSPDTEDDDAD